MSDYNHNAVYYKGSGGLTGAMLLAQILIWFAAKGDMHGYNVALQMVKLHTKKA